jgi:hypothetical protein
MIIKLRVIIVSFCLLNIFLPVGCRDKNEDSAQIQADNVLCPMLYQKSDSIAEALKFIDVPEDRFVFCLSSVRSRGHLADWEQLEFANRLFAVRKSRDTDEFISLLSNATRDQLYDDNNKRMLHYYIEEIKNGSFICGGNDFKLFAIFAEFTDKDEEKLKKHVAFGEKPTHIVTYYHFDKPKNMLMGTNFYLLKEKDSYKLVTETLLAGEIPAVSKSPRTVGENYGIISHQYEEDAYNKMNIWKYQWKVELDSEETSANQFEILVLTEDISAGQEATTETTQKKRVKADIFEKHKDGQLSFRFRVGDKEPKSDLDMSGTHWGFGLSMSGMGLSNWINFPGTGITNIKVKKEGGFVGPYLEFMSFETTDNSVKYKHRVVLCKTPTDPEEKPVD